MSDVVRVVRETARNMNEFTISARDKTLDALNKVFRTVTRENNEILSRIDSLRATEAKNNDAVVKTLQEATSAVGTGANNIVEAVT